MWIIIAAGCVALILGIVLLIRGIRHRRQKKLLRQKAQDRLREEALDRALVGNAGAMRETGAALPFDVRYDVDHRKESAGKGTNVTAQPMMLHLVERSELSTRKYMFHIVDHITFGRSIQNDLVIGLPQVADVQCEIFRLDKELYVKNLGNEGVAFLTRRGKRLMVDSRSLLLRNGDQLQVGKYSYEIKFL